MNSSISDGSCGSCSRLNRSSAIKVKTRDGVSSSESCWTTVGFSGSNSKSRQKCLPPGPVANGSSFRDHGMSSGKYSRLERIRPNQFEISNSGSAPSDKFRKAPTRPREPLRRQYKWSTRQTLSKFSNRYRYATGNRCPNSSSTKSSSSVLHCRNEKFGSSRRCDDKIAKVNSSMSAVFTNSASCRTCPAHVFRAAPPKERLQPNLPYERSRNSAYMSNFARLMP